MLLSSMTNRLSHFLRFVTHRFHTDKLLPIAAALTFTSLLSLVPLLSISFTILGAFPAFKSIGNNIKDFIFAHFVPTSSAILQNNLDQIISHTSRLTVMGSVTLLITALLTLSTIERAFNDIWRVRRSRNGISAFMLYWAVLTLTPMFFGISLAVSSYLFSLPFITQTATSLGLQNVLLAFSSFMLEVAAFTWLYIAVPHCQVRWQHALFGGVIVGICFELIKKIFAWYVSDFTSYEVLYGALAIIPVFLLWVYIFWVLILLGAEVVNALSFDHTGRDLKGDHHFIMAFMWLGYLWQAQLEGRSVSLASLLQHHGGNGHVEPETVIQAMISARMVHQLDSGEYSLARDLNHMTLGSFYQAMPWKLPQAASWGDSTHPWLQTLTQHVTEANSGLAEDLAVALVGLYALKS